MLMLRMYINCPKLAICIQYNADCVFINKQLCLKNPETFIGSHSLFFLCVTMFIGT